MVGFIAAAAPLLRTNFLFQLLFFLIWQSNQSKEGFILACSLDSIFHIGEGNEEGTSLLSFCPKLSSMACGMEEIETDIHQQIQNMQVSDLSVTE